MDLRCVRLPPDEIYISVRQDDGEYHGIFLQLIKIIEEMHLIGKMAYQTDSPSCGCCSSVASRRNVVILTA